MKRMLTTLGVIAIIVVLIFAAFPKMGVYEYLFDRGTYRESYDNPQAIITDLDELTPKTKELALEFLERCEEEGLKVKITETYRTKERQEKLYAQGRTEEGPVVTWTKNSKHTTRRAFDICQQGDNPYGDEEFFRKCAEIGKEVGLSPGYYWERHQDKPHYELDKWWLP